MAAETEKVTPVEPQKIIVIPEQHTFAPVFALSGILLVLVSVWAIWDETYGRRPWKMFQKEFKSQAAAVYRETRDARQRELTQLGENAKLAAKAAAGDADATRALDSLTKSDVEKAKAYLAAQTAQIKSRQAFNEAGGPGKEASILAELQKLNTESAELRKVFQVKRGAFQAKTWEFEIFHDSAARDEMSRLEKEIVPQENKLVQFEARKRALTEERTALLAEKVRTDAVVAGFDADRSAAQGLLNGIQDRGLEVRHQFVDELKAVDRCETCHSGVSDPGLEKLPIPFKTHSGDWLAIHPKEKFGCTSCHRGEGYATTSVWKAHGQDHYWLEPMLPGEMMQATCYKCHEGRTVLRGAEILMKGKKLVRDVGCIGCHKIRGFGDDETEFKSLTEKIARLETDLTGLKDAYAAASDTEQNSEMSKLAPQIEALGRDIKARKIRASDLDRSIQQIAPDLTKLAVKIRPGWLVPWLKDPRSFRPATRMPRFWPDSGIKEVTEKGQWEIERVAAYLMEASEQPSGPGPAAPDPEAVKRGQAIVGSVGCKGCHNVTAEDRTKVTKRRYASDLDRVGEKMRMEWLEAWVRDPKKVQPHARMPSLRLSEAEAKDVAAYLMTLKSAAPPPEYDEVPPFLAPGETRTQYAKEGERIVRKYGCFGCHTIKGMENQGKLGTELSQHGVKTIPEFDWGTAHLEEEFDKPRGGLVWKNYVENHLETFVKDLAEFKRKQHQALKEAYTELTEDDSDVDSEGFVKAWLGQNPGDTASQLDEELRKDVTRHPETLIAWASKQSEAYQAAERTFRDTHPDGKAEHLVDRLIFWRRHDGRIHPSREMYFATKIMNPRIIDHGREKPYEDRLKMPQFNLTADEMIAIATFLLGQTPELDTVPAAWRDRPQGPAQALMEGERIIQRYNCEGCHRVEMFPSRPLRNTLAERLEARKDRIRAGLLRARAKADAKAKPDDKKGPYTPRALEKKVQEAFQELAAEEFKKADRALEGEVYSFYTQETVNVTPPPLYVVGAKVRPDWLFDFLKVPYTLRPKHQIRMPTFNFSDEDAMSLTRYFSARASQPYPYRYDERPAPTADRIALGKKLLDDNKCLSCHIPGLPDQVDKSTLIAPNLDLAPRRLKGDWITEWILDPGLIQPGVVMPAYKETLGEGAAEKAQAISDYLTHLPAATASAPPAPAPAPSPGGD